MRREIKYLLHPAEYAVLVNRVKAALPPDTHTVSENGYAVTSVYFDDLFLTAYRQKLSGIGRRAKYRLRCYNHNDGLILLERKARFNEYVEKTAVPVTREEYARLIRGDFDFLLDRPEPVLRAFYEQHITRRMRPVLTVDYFRQAFADPAGRVRVTFDLHINASAQTDLFTRGPTYAIANSRCVMELKYSGFLPARVAALLTGFPLLSEPVSKYVLSVDKLKEVNSHV